MATSVERPGPSTAVHAGSMHDRPVRTLRHDAGQHVPRASRAGDQVRRQDSRQERRLALHPGRGFRYIRHRLVRHGFAERQDGQARRARLEDCLKNISRYLDSAQSPTSNGTQYDYTPETFSTLAVSAEGLLCRQYLGWKQNDPRLIDGCKFLNRRRVDYDGDELNVYYWYYATQACHHMEGDIWNDWNSVMRQASADAPNQEGRTKPAVGIRAATSGAARTAAGCT